MTDPKRRLGRGLEALLGPSTTVEAARARGSLSELPVDAIQPNRFQPRRVFEERALGELADSLRTVGLIQPILVRDIGDHRFELIAGERRWRAAQHLAWEKIGSIVRDVDDQTLLTLALVENLQRDALSPIEEARGYQRLIDEFSVTQSSIGDLVGRDRTTVANALRLLKLPEPVQELVHAGRLSAGHGRALLSLSDADAIERAAKIIVDQGLTVRQAEEIGRVATSEGARRSRSPRRISPELRRLEDVLRRRLQTDVKVSRRGKASGRVSVNFYSHEDLARILEIILGKPYDG